MVKQNKNANKTTKISSTYFLKKPKISRLRRETEDKDALIENIFITMNSIKDMFRCGEKNGFDFLLGMKIKSLSIDQLLDISVRVKKVHSALDNSLTKGTIFNEHGTGPDFFSLLDRMTIEENEK